MVLPIEIYAIKAGSLIQGLVLATIGKKEIASLRRDDVAGSRGVSVGALLVYRVAMCVVGISVGGVQLLDKGPRALAFFTVWNWWLLTAYFALAALSSARVLLAAKGSSARKRAAAMQKADIIEKAAATMYHVAVPMAILVDLMTWFVLVPMLMAHPDPKRVEAWKALMFCFSSYMQHGGNAAMALGDLAVNRIPLLPYWSVASISIFTSFYSVWSTVHFYLFGTFLYPFLEAHRPYAWIAYLGLFLSHWAVFLLFAAIMKVKQAVVDGKVPWSREGLGKGARGRTPRKVR